MSTYRIICDGLGKRRHSPELLGVIHDAWAQPRPATRERQAEHAALATRVLGDHYAPKGIIEPVRGLLISSWHHKRSPERDSDGEWLLADGILREGERIVFTCQKPCPPVKLREATLTGRLADIEPGDVLVRTLAT